MGKITLREYYKGRDATHASELSDSIRRNAEVTVRLVNDLLAIMGGGPVIVSSGWRPSAINKAAGGAAKSNHMLGRAVDLADADGKIDAWCLEHLDVLEECDLWLEDPASTPTWCHLQTVAPGSGRRVFRP